MIPVHSAYIHIPFCQSMCHYCSFVKYVYNENLASSYLEGLAREIDAYLPSNKNQLDTVYIGGGTPTSLNITQLDFLFKTIHKKIDVSRLKEFTIEVNPGDIDEDKTKLLKANGINRISFGVQVMDDQMLKQIGRSHSVKDVYHTMDLFTKNNFSNISLDLIYALPHQTVNQFTRSLNEAMQFDLPHYSTYSLQIEPKTVFYHRHKKGQLHRPVEDDEVQMYEILQDTMKAKGIDQYEISNFSKPGFESKHNIVYWNNDYYYGFGAGASGYLPGKRTRNMPSLKSYINQAMNDGKPIFETDKITLKESVEEEMFLGLRKIKGYDIRIFEEKFGFPLELIYGEQLDQLRERGLIAVKEGRLKLTEQGMLLADRVFEYFMLDYNQLSVKSRVNVT